MVAANSHSCFPPQASRYNSNNLLYHFKQVCAHVIQGAFHLVLHVSGFSGRHFEACEVSRIKLSVVKITLPRCQEIIYVTRVFFYKCNKCIAL